MKAAQLGSSRPPGAHSLSPSVRLAGTDQAQQWALNLDLLLPLLLLVLFQVLLGVLGPTKAAGEPCSEVVEALLRSDVSVSWTQIPSTREVQAAEETTQLLHWHNRGSYLIAALALRPGVI